MTVFYDAENEFLRLLQRIEEAEKVAHIQDGQMARLSDRIAALESGEIDITPPPSNLLWSDDFAGNWLDRWPFEHVGNRYEVQPVNRNGETWLRVLYPQGIRGRGFKATTHQGPYERAYLEYQVEFNRGFKWNLGGKLVGLGGGVTGTSGVTPDGTDFWTARFMWFKEGRGTIYMYHPDKRQKYGENIPFANDVRFESGRVHTLGMEVVMNTPGERDGVIRGWLDGDLVAERTTMRWRTTKNLQIDAITFLTFFGGATDDWAPLQDELITFGNFKLWAKKP